MPSTPALPAEMSIDELTARVNELGEEIAVQKATVAMHAHRGEKRWGCGSDRQHTDIHLSGYLLALAAVLHMLTGENTETINQRLLEHGKKVVGA